ncbi:FoF1 ATP synthase subunit gamma [Celeribacter indicus]|uniref:ATP synthase F1 subunit gamma n=1 Tax=Celeribacter indicus TaxID=1208324 RepID=A0A0B5DZH9_9RHOB|nr:FoF1 ATP synthase subunit gamma [Celeribacter indicus]AJE48439.1 ATP synthase F1 subunit gamma [Celeribacter indicus]SDX29314.1 F-type H+-transporting ATPase subunit gamma [Celeribacter indicus]
MAQSLEVLAHHTETLHSIRGIVRTMKTMSAINALPYEQAATAIEAYRNTVLDGFHAFLHRNGPLPRDRAPAGAPVVIAFGSDHGLCGNYNELIAAEVDRTVEASRLICVGAQLEDALAGQGLGVAATLFPPATADGLGRLAGRLITRLDAMRHEAAPGDIAVSLVFMQRAAHGQQAPVSRRLLPLDPELMAELAVRPWTSRSLPHLTLTPDALLAALIRSYLFAEIFRAAAEALVTENASRLARMQQAEQSVDERLEELTAETRSVRQSEITTELLDVVIGFEALKDRDKRRQGEPPADPSAGEDGTG